MEKILDRIKSISLIPVVVDELTGNDSIDLGQALIDGGIPVVELTFRASGTSSAIAKMRKHFSNLLVGAGTVLTIEQADLAIRSGAQFIVSPGLNVEIVKFCQAQGVVIIPGVATPTEIEMALSLGLETVKFFPASASGGVETMKALNGPYKQVTFVPTGGITMAELPEYSSYEGIAAIGGTFMLGKHVQAKEWDCVTELCKQSVRSMLGLRLSHIGINSQYNDNSTDTVQAFTDLLFLPESQEANKSLCAVSVIGVLNQQNHDSRGYISFTCHNVQRAKGYLEFVGIELNAQSAIYDNRGALSAINLKSDIERYTIHLYR